MIGGFNLSPALLAAVFFATLTERLGGIAPAGLLAEAALAGYLLLEFRRLPRQGLIVISCMLGVSALVAPLIDDPLAAAEAGLAKACFFATFFTAVGFLRSAAESSPLVRRCGAHLVAQPPGRRYLALTWGTHLYALILSYGATELFGQMIRRANTLASAGGDAAVRALRQRRMLLAVFRGMANCTCWSPLAIMLVVVLSVVPQVTWQQVVPLGFLFGAALNMLGWSMDRFSAARQATSGGARPAIAEGVRWTVHLRIFALIATIFGVAVALETLLDTHLILAVAMTVPGISIGWIVLQYGRAGGWRALALTGRRLRRHVATRFPQHRMEVVILGGAGFVGTMVAAAVPTEAVAAWVNGLHLPAVALPVAAIWVIAATGQLGLNPIVSVTVVGAALGDPRGLGLDPAVVALAYMCGWSLATNFSPFVAVSLIVARIAGTSAFDVTARWNGPFVLAGAVVTSLGVIALHLLRMG